MSLEQLIVGQVSGVVADKLASKFNLDAKTTAMVASIAVPLLLKALQHNASKPAGAASLHEAVATQHDGSILNDLAGAITSDSTAKDGSGILGHVLGSNTDGIIDAISKSAGVDANAAGGILASLAPVVLGQLGKETKAEGLDAGGLAGLLGGQSLSGGDALSGAVSSILGDGDTASGLDDLVKLGASLLK